MLVATLKDVRRNANIARFLLARLIYNDGLNTLFAFGGIYAAGTFGMTLDEVLLFGIALNVTAGLGAFGFAFLDDRIGSKPTILIAICGLFVAGTVALLAEEKTTFWAVALVHRHLRRPGAVGQPDADGPPGPARPAHRDVRHLRADRQGHGLHRPVPVRHRHLAGFSTQRAGMATILVMFVVGGLLLMRVREPPRG